MSLEEVIKHPAHLFSKQPFPLMFSSIIYYIDILLSLHWLHQGDSSFLFLIDFSHFLPIPTLTVSVKPPSHSQDAADSFSDVSSPAPFLGPCPDLGAVLAALNSVSVTWLRPFFIGWSLMFAYWIWNQTWIWAVRGSGILFSNIWNMKAHCTLCKKGFLLLCFLVDVKRFLKWFL